MRRPSMVKRRRDAASAYERLIRATDIDRHHHIEVLAQALGVDEPAS